VVDLLMSYSKRVDLTSSLFTAVDRVRDANQAEPAGALSVRSEQAPRGWRVTDRVTEEGLSELVSAFRHGATIRELAERYGISESSVKRRLRAQGVGRAARHA
jgi:DNA-directed RNA polymerase specialized sigma24 family protein